MPQARALTTALALCTLCLPANANAAPTATLKATLRPEQLGASTTIKFAFSIAYNQETPSPVTLIELRYPAHLGIGTSGLGLSTCRANKLIGYGPKGCPSTSVMGYGTGRIEIPFAENAIGEPVRLTTFMAPLHKGNLGLLFYVDAERPIAAELTFHGTILPSNTPYGGNLTTTVPIVPTLPGASDAILSQFSTTIGPEHITYWEYSRHHYIPYHPRGIQLPKQCPHNGFQFAATFTFANNTTTNTHTTVQCPRPATRGRYHTSPHIRAPRSPAADTSPQSRITAETQAALLKEANQTAASEGDSHPYDIEAVKATARAAERVTCGACKVAAGGDAGVYLLAMRGHFACNTCRHPHNQSTLGGTVITLILDAKTMVRREFWLGKHYPDLRRAGVPVRLDVPTKHQPPRS